MECLSSLRLLLLLQIGSRKDQPRYSVGQLEFVEVDDQSQGNVEEFHVTEQLCLMDRMNLFDCLYFDKQTLVD